MTRRIEKLEAEVAGLAETIREAAEQGSALEIQGQGSKRFLGRSVAGAPLGTLEHKGIISHEPSELTLHARAGTLLRDIDTVLAEHQQELAFEPPRFSGKGTLGGAIASGLSGPARPFRGAARDFVLGASVINGHGKWLRFGGQVMKNVAGYDVSRLLTGSMGTLGLITDVSLKVLPVPEQELTLRFDFSQAQAIGRLVEWRLQPLPMSAACWVEGGLYIRLSGVTEDLQISAAQLGGDTVADGRAWWATVRDHEHAFFKQPGELWRLCVPPATPELALRGHWMTDWAGAQRWLITEESTATVRAAVELAGGHATLFNAVDTSAEVFHPLPEPMLLLQQRIKQSMDPAGIMNPGRMYASI